MNVAIRGYVDNREFFAEPAHEVYPIPEENKYIDL